MSSTATAGRLSSTWPGSGPLLDVAIAAAAFAWSLAQLSHHGSATGRPRSTDLDLVGVVLAACSTLPLIAWRRSPLGVFVVTTAAGVSLAGVGYPVDLIHGEGSAARIELVFGGAAVERTVTNPATANGAFRVHARVPYGGHRS